MTSYFQETIPTPEGVVADSPAATGALRVEVPHWATRVAIYDSKFRAVSGGSPIAERAASPEVYGMEISLAAGIYDVEASFAGAAERLQVPVSAGLSTRIPAIRWKFLQLRSSAPLALAAPAPESLVVAAEEWSRKTTWQESSGNSRLFLFVRGLDPEYQHTFAGGLKLLNAQGRLVVDLSQALVQNARQGWAAFNAELPAGGYIVRRGGRNVSLRFQPVYLAEGWTTQIFLMAERYPRLHTSTMNMASPDSGFQANDESAVAAEVLLNSLASPEITELAASDQVRALLEGKQVNPWLAIVAAYGLSASRPPAGDAQEAKAKPRQLPRYVRDVLDRVADHPDARALTLDDKKAAVEPFWFPPTLRVGLGRIEQHWDNHEDTVPQDSLTDLVLENTITNSPWTAWRELSRSPEPAPEAASSAGRGRSLLYVHHASPADQAVPTFVDELARMTSAAAPVFYLAETPMPSDRQVGSILLDTVRQADALPASSSADPLVQTAREIARPGGASAIPGTVTIDRGLDKLLQSVSADDVTAVSGVPRPRAERGLERLRESAKTGALEGRGGSAELLTPSVTDQTILAAALVQGDYPATTDADTEDVQAREPKQPTTRISIETCVVRLRAEADRIRDATAKSRSKGMEDDAQGALALVKRLHHVADTLLSGAGFTVVTDRNGRIVYGNGAFRDLLSRSYSSTDDAHRAKAHAKPEKLAEQQAWEKALKDAKLQESDLPSPVPNAICDTWLLQRTAIVDNETQDVSAFLNVLRIPNALVVNGDMMEKFPPLLTKLSFHAPLFAYGSPSNRSQHLQELASLTQQFEQIVGIGSEQP